MNPKIRKAFSGMLLLVMVCSVVAMTAFAADADAGAQSTAFYGTFWALVPPIIAIVLALITKEVYSSLFIGILVGGLFYSGFSFTGTIQHVFVDGMIGCLSSSSNVGILLFLIILGSMVSMMNRAGGSAAFGRWASAHIKTRSGAQLATIALGVLIFVDDYFNCLTVGSVMRPVTDQHNISRAKLSYIIDATAAPICIIAPISSWAAAVTGFVDGVNGLTLFIRAIPYNFYAFLTIVMMIFLALTNFDYGPMKLHEKNAQTSGDLFTTGSHPYAQTEDTAAATNGKVKDLVIPIVVLIVCCVTGMIYTGGFFDGVDFVTAFSKSNASISLTYGSVFALIITMILYVPRRVLSFKKCMECLPDGFRSIVPAILILTFAWTLKAMTDSLGAKEYVAALVKQSSAGSFLWLLPAMIFLIAIGLSFATGTSWGTFGILIPIVVSAFDSNMSSEIMIVAISACMAGAVCGDHCSPISDTTIMASAGAQCDHINHVSTQLPYALTVAAVSFACYLIAGRLIYFGVAHIAWIMLPFSIGLMIATLFTIRVITRKS